MLKTLTNVGNSKAIILPKRLIEKYNLDQVIIEETSKGILILPASGSFEQKLNELKKQKKEVNALIKQQAEDPETISYYKGFESLGDIDVEVIDE